MPLELLKELVGVVNRNKVKRIEIIGDANDSPSQLNELYKGITEGRFDSTEDVARFFFDDSPYRIKYANRLQRKLKDRLLNTLFFVDVNQKGFSDIQKAYYTCHKNLAAVKILLGRYARKNGAALAEETIKIALHFEFTDLILELARELRMHYAYVPGRKKKFNYYDNLVGLKSEILLAEMEAEKYYTLLTRELNQSKVSKSNLIESAEKYSRKLESMMMEFQSYRFSFHAYLVISMAYELKNDYKGNLRISKEALKFFNKKNQIASNTILIGFQIKTLVSNIYLGKYDEANHNTRKLESLTLEGSNNWYHALDYTMILFFHSKKYNDAFETLQKAIKHPNFKNQYGNISEHWRIHEAFIYLLIQLKKINPSEETNLKKFRVKKFLNEVPTYTKDKLGANINILILHVLFLLQQKKYDEIIDRMESLKTYTHRYLRRDETFRSNCFIKMLLTLPQTSFNRKAVVRRAQKYWALLQEVPLDKAKQSVELEIIPYETLWQFTLELLIDDRYKNGRAPKMPNQL